MGSGIKPLALKLTCLKKYMNDKVSELSSYFKIFLVFDWHIVREGVIKDIYSSSI